MITRYINGREIAADIHDEVKDEIEHEKLDLGLAAVLVGNDEASHIYVRLKERAAKRDGIRFERITLPSTTAQGELLSVIEELNDRDDIHAILIQLPLPKQIDADEVILSIDPAKDVDGFHPVNVDRFIAGQSAVPPVLTQAIVAMLESTNEKLDGRHAIVVANSPALFAPPVSAALSPLNVTTDWTKIDASDYKERLKSADIVIVALGKPGSINKEMIKDGAILIDIGTTKVDGKVVGDVDPNVDNHASWRSPVPGGIGPVTVATLMKNVLTCYRKQENRL
ncbi:bifunctional 5,10-methylenetetrahydrofolate dehydrogenase/5,10-methenyltetrahydrofolate cyclohydrolase [Candidatus Uhrbacteria bacterium]|nr:bifunctional 5,10-methylenetetrahydrofolate dehydrogenase/5,10-methenyltetrahydrofolate cyclohydrolase [Candidatus Uhrbacteria bacterium]